MGRLDTKRINDLIVRISQGDKSSLEKLFQYTYQNMKAVVAFYSVYSENIDDILSELYLNIYRYAHAFDKEKNGYNWMTQIAKNLCTNYNSTQEIACDFDENLLQANENEAERIIDYLFFEEAFRLLNESEKNYILLVYWHGFTVKEIAKAKKVTVSAVYNSLHRAYKKLKKFYYDV